MSKYTLPTIRISFEHQVRKAWVLVEAEAWHDAEGIHKVAIANVWMDGAEVFDLLTPQDILDIESAIEPAIAVQHSEDVTMKGY